MHPSTAHVMQFFAYDHLPEKLQLVSKPFCELATQVAQELPDNPEKTAALRPDRQGRLKRAPPTGRSRPPLVGTFSPFQSVKRRLYTGAMNMAWNTVGYQVVAGERLEEFDTLAEAVDAAFARLGELVAAGVSETEAGLAVQVLQVRELAWVRCDAQRLARV